MGAAASVAIDELDPSLREQIEKVQADGGDSATLKRTALEWASTQKDKNAVGRVEKWCLEAGINAISVESRDANQQTVNANSVGCDAKTAHQTSGSKETNSTKLKNCIRDWIKRFWTATVHSRDELSEKEFIRLHVRIQKAMSAKFQESDAVAVSENLFKKIVGSSPGQGCCFNTFSKAMSTIAADFLGHQAGAEAYHHFLGLLLSHITVGVSRSLVQSLWEVGPCEELLDAAKLKASVPSVLPEASKTEMTWDPAYVGMMSTSKEMLQNYSFSSDKSGSCEAARTEHKKGMISVIRAMEGFPSNKVLNQHNSTMQYALLGVLCANFWLRVVTDAVSACHYQAISPTQ